MSEPARKQERSTVCPPTSVKKRKRGPPARPPEFWDNLSEIPLEESALVELNRRNNQRALTRAPRHPWTRSQTAKALKEGPDFSDLRGFAMTRSNFKRRKVASTSRNSASSTSTKSTGPYDRAFGQHLTDHGILQDGYEYPNGPDPPRPENEDELLKALAKPRGSLSPSQFTQDDFRKFKRADAQAAKEWQVTSNVIPIIEGSNMDGNRVSGQIPFNNLEPLTDGSLVPGNPDRYHGARPEEIDRRVRANLETLIIPSTQRDLPAAPNFFVAVKGPDGSAAVAKRQACYDGALGARGMHALKTFGAGESAYDNKAYTLTSIYQDGTLKIFTSHPVCPAPERTRPEFVMTQVKAVALTSDADSFRAGAKSYRNACDWAKKQRDEAIKKANERATGDDSSVLAPAYSFTSDTYSQNTLTTTCHQSNVPSSPGSSDTSADELGATTPQPENVARPRYSSTKSARTK
jgi:hypothetical protein